MTNKILNKHKTNHDSEHKFILWFVDIYMWQIIYLNVRFKFARTYFRIAFFWINFKSVMFNTSCRRISQYWNMLFSYGIRRHVFFNLRTKFFPLSYEYFNSHFYFSNKHQFFKCYSFCSTSDILLLFYEFYGPVSKSVSELKKKVINKQNGIEFFLYIKSLFSQKSYLFIFATHLLQTEIDSTKCWKNLARFKKISKKWI